LQKSGSISAMEAEILGKNKVLAHHLKNFERLWEKPETIAQISFQPKPLIENGIFTVGDAAGMITPLCGNGMSMALHGSAILANTIFKILEGKERKEQIENAYQHQMRQAFSIRLKAGRLLQSAVLNDTANSLALGLLNGLPFLKRPVISLTHGKPFLFQK